MSATKITLICIAVAMFIIPFLCYVADRHISVRNELTYIDSEIKRSDGKEKEMWIKRRKNVLKRLIPFVH